LRRSAPSKTVQPSAPSVWIRTPAAMTRQPGSADRGNGRLR